MRYHRNGLLHCFFDGNGVFLKKLLLLKFEDGLQPRFIAVSMLRRHRDFSPRIYEDLVLFSVIVPLDSGLGLPFFLLFIVF